MWLDILVGMVVCFELGDEKNVNLVVYVGSWEIYGFNGLVNGFLEWREFV